MWDKADIRIPFDSLFVNKTKSGEAGFIDPELYDFPMFCDVVMVNGTKEYSVPKSQKWGSISSSLSSVAIGFFPDGFGLYHWPHVTIKASPTKILQGHNVFGSENIRAGVMQMLSNLKVAFPKISAHLDFKSTEIRYLDSTYSTFIQSEFYRTKIISMFDSLVPEKNSRKRYEGYLQLNNDSEYRRQKIYYKHQELLSDLDKAKRLNEKDRVAILSNQLLQDFAYGRLRFEATTGYRAMENDGIPTNLIEFLHFHDWYEDTHKEPLCRLLWRRAFKKLFSQIEGHTMKNVDDNHIKLKIDAKYIAIKSNGKICKRKANAVFRTYRQIKLEGYNQLAKEKNTTFFVNVRLLIDAGISRAFLKSLDPHRPHENVFHMITLIEIDFSKQRPDWYQEPALGYDDTRRHLRLVS